VPSYTPVATPVVPAPERKVEDRAREPGQRLELTAPVTVITPQGDLELGTGSLLIGRLPECDVLLQDNLVSRMHARISVQHDGVVVEDLHSTNGVYVNGRRVGHSRELRTNLLLTGSVLCAAGTAVLGIWFVDFGGGARAQAAITPRALVLSGSF